MIWCPGSEVLAWVQYVEEVLQGACEFRTASRSLKIADQDLSPLLPLLLLWAGLERVELAPNILQLLYGKNS